MTDPQHPLAAEVAALRDRVAALEQTLALAQGQIRALAGRLPAQQQQQQQQQQPQPQQQQGLREPPPPGGRQQQQQQQQQQYPPGGQHQQQQQGQQIEPSEPWNLRPPGGGA